MIALGPNYSDAYHIAGMIHGYAPAISERRRSMKRRRTAQPA